MDKIKMASETLAAMEFLGISLEKFQELTQKHTLVGLHEKLGHMLAGENIAI